MSRLYGVLPILGLLLVGCAGTQQRPREFPAWVENTPSRPDAIFAVGFSQAHLDTSETLEEAINNAYENLAKSVQVRVSAIVTEWRKRRDVFTQEQISEKTPEEILKMVEEKARVLDRWFNRSTGECYVLISVSTGVLEVLTAGRKRPERTEGPPEWINVVPQKKGFFYAVGRAPRYLVPSESQKEAEKIARANLARRLGSEISALVLDCLGKFGGDIQMITKEVSEVSLSGVEIVARWEDPQKGVHYALARMPIRSIKRDVLERAKAVLKKEAGENETLTEEAIKELEKALERY